MPFSDPLADGPTIQRSTFEALRQGMTLAGTLALIERARLTRPGGRLQLPQPILRYGVDRFLGEADGARRGRPSADRPPRGWRSLRRVAGAGEPARPDPPGGPDHAAGAAGDAVDGARRASSTWSPAWVSPARPRRWREGLETRSRGCAARRRCRSRSASASRRRRRRATVARHGRRRGGRERAGGRARHAAAWTRRAPSSARCARRSTARTVAR